MYSILLLLPTAHFLIKLVCFLLFLSADNQILGGLSLSFLEKLNCKRGQYKDGLVHRMILGKLVRELITLFQNSHPNSNGMDE
jgi:hypothetical protein